MPEKITINVSRCEIDLDPNVEVFQVEVGQDKGVWLETIPTEDGLRWFLRGMQAMASCTKVGYLPLPETPTVIKHFRVVEDPDD